MSKVKQLRPIDKMRVSRGCECYGTKPLRIVIDSDTRLVYCDHCGNIIEPFVALQLLCKEWDKLEALEQDVRKRLKRSWDVGRNYKPWRRALKDLEKQMGRRGNVLPCCPHCDKPFKIEDIKNFRVTVPQGSFSSVGHSLGRF